MKRIPLTLFLFLIGAAMAVAQQNQPAAQTFTLDQCIDYALQNSNTLKNSVLGEQIANARVKETRGIGLPQIDASVGILHNQKLPRFFGRNTTDTTSFSFFQNVPGAQEGDIVAGQNFFQLRSGGNASVTITQILFNGSYLVGLKAANAYRELSVKQTNQTREQVVEQVTKAFFTALVNAERMKLFDNNIGRIDSLLSTTKALNKNGFVESIDVDRIQVSLNNLKTERDKFQNLQELSIELLKFQLNYPMEAELAVSGSLDDIQIPESALQYEQNWDYTTRSDYQLLMANKRLQLLDVKNKYAAGLPSLGAMANLGYSTQSADIAGLFKTESSGVVDNGSVGPDKWYSFSTFGVTLNIPLFSGLQRNYRLQQSKITLQQLENNTNILKSTIALETKSSGKVFENSLKTLVSQRENMKLAENVARVTKIKYEQGVGSNIEVIDAESSLKESQINYYNALYDALIAKVDLDKAYGKLVPQPSTDNK
jgi:outer membrane protein TolC